METPKMDIEDLRRERRLAAEAMAARFNDNPEPEVPQPTTKKEPIKPISTTFTPEKERPTLAKPAASTAAPVKKDPSECKNKAEVIAYILELQEKVGVLPNSKALKKTHLEPKTRDELNSLCAGLIDRSMDVLQLPKPKETYEAVKDEKGETIGVQKLPEPLPSDTKSVEVAAEALYSFQSLAISVLEAASINLGPRFGMTSDFEGLNKDIDAKKSEIKTVLGKIYQEYGPQITLLLKPINQYGFIMIGLAQTRYLVNKDKKNTPQPLIVSSTQE